MSARKLYVCGRTWAVEMKDDLRDENDRQLLGETVRYEQVIRVRKSLPIEVEASVILHELLHAILATVTNGNYPADEEACVQALEAGLVDVLRNKRNDWLWEMLQVRG